MMSLLDSLLTLRAETYREEMDWDSAENEEEMVHKGSLMIHLGPPKSRRVISEAGEEYVSMRKFQANATVVARVAATEGDTWSVGGAEYVVHECEPIFDPTTGSVSHTRGWLRTRPAGLKPLPAPPVLP